MLSICVPGCVWVQGEYGIWVAQSGALFRVVFFVQGLGFLTFEGLCGVWSCSGWRCCSW